MSGLRWVLLGILVIVLAIIVFGRGCTGPEKVVTIEKFYGEVEEGNDPDSLELEDSKSKTERAHSYFIDRIEDGERYKEYPRVVAYGDGKIRIIGPEEEGGWELEGRIKDEMYFRSHEQTSQQVGSPHTYKDWVITWWYGDDYEAVVIKDISREGQKTFKISLK